MTPKVKKLLKQKIEHEDNLISQRFMWLLTAEAVLINAYFLAGDVGCNQCLIAIAGFVSTFVFGFFVLIGVLSLRKLRRLFHNESTLDKLLYSGYDMFGRCKKLEWLKCIVDFFCKPDSPCCVVGVVGLFLD